MKRNTNKRNIRGHKDNRDEMGRLEKKRFKETRNKTRWFNEYVDEMNSIDEELAEFFRVEFS